MGGRDLLYTWSAMRLLNARSDMQQPGACPVVYHGARSPRAPRELPTHTHVQYENGYEVESLLLTYEYYIPFR